MDPHNTMTSGTKSSFSQKKQAKAETTEEDPNVITRKKMAKQKCGNPECYARGTEVTLKTCARCKSTRYCSRECQSANWKTHKPWCNNNTEHVQELANADATGFSFGLPPGVTLLELDQKLEKLVKFHSNMLMAATIHGLSLSKDIKRSRMYILCVQVSYRRDNGGVNAKAFRVDDAFLIDMDSPRARGTAWRESIDQIQTMREESEALKRGTVAAVALECAPLAMQIVPFGSLRDLSPLKIQQNWKEILIKNVENGKKFTGFELNQ